MTEEEQIEIFEEMLVEDAQNHPMPMSKPVDKGFNLGKLIRQYEHGDLNKDLVEKYPKWWDENKFYGE